MRLDRSGTPDHRDESLPSMPVWDGGLFSEPFPFRIFLFRKDTTALNGLLGWLDMWHSGLLTRTLAPFFRAEKQFPESFLLFTATPPLHHGFLLLPIDGFSDGQLAETLLRITRQMKLEIAVIDVAMLSNDTLLELESIAKENRLPGESLRIFLSDPSDFPASCLTRTAGTMKGLQPPVPIFP